MNLAELNRQEGVTPEVSALIDQLFTYQEWSEAKVKAGQAVRAALSKAYAEILENVPSCPTRTRALNMLIDCRQTANAAITFDGQV